MLAAVAHGLSNNTIDTKSSALAWWINASMRGAFSALALAVFRLGS
jgi:hypothetical protein